MQCTSSFSHAWMHVVLQYRAQSLLPCSFYHKSQSSEASNHKSTDKATIISLFANSASPSSSSRSHLTALVTPGSTSKGHPGCKWCSPSNALRQTTTKKYHRRHRNGEGSQIQLLPPFVLYTRPVYQNYNLERATNTNRGKIDGVSNQGH